MMPRAVASPSPVPRPTGFVVKKGSNRCASTSGDMPWPVSATERRAHARPRTRSSAGSASAGTTVDASATVTVPWSPIASRALASRFRTTACSCVVSARTRPASGRRSKQSSVSRPTMSVNMRVESRSQVASSTSRRSAGTARLRPRSCFVSVLAACAASWISRSSARTGAAASASSASSQPPRMTASRLLKSWATPPARRPTSSIFCAWRSFASASSRRACSRRPPIP